MAAVGGTSTEILSPFSTFVMSKPVFPVGPEREVLETTSALICVDGPAGI